MKTKIILLLAGYVMFQEVTAQTAKSGINTLTPNNTLTVGGSFGAAYKEITANTTLTDLDHYITYNGATSGTIILPAISTVVSTKFTGRMYKVKNLSSQNVTLQAAAGNTIRSGSTTPTATFLIPSGAYVEIVCTVNNTNWDLSFVGAPTLTNVEIYGTQLNIPPHQTFAPDFTNHTVTTYDSGLSPDHWFVISKTSTFSSISPTGLISSSTVIIASQMVIVYEYQGTPFNLSNLYPVLTSGNNSSYPDIYNASYGGISNASGKTRLTVNVSRTDKLGSSSGWAGTFLLNVLLARKIN